MLNSNLKYVFSILILFSYSVYGQLDTTKFRCASPDNPPVIGGLQHKTPVYGQFLRVMLVYVKFKNDATQGNFLPYKCVWPNWRDNKPTNPYTLDGSFIDGNEQHPSNPFMTRYRNYTLSDYWCEMSRGDYDVIGEEYYVQTIEEASHYRNNNLNYSHINREVLQTLEASGQAPNFSLYNNWTYNGSSYNWTPASGDNTVDMIIMVYRNIPGGNGWFFSYPLGASGIDNLGISPLTFDNTQITSYSGVTCVTNLDNYSKVTQVWEHEMGHRWWGHHSIGIMTGYEDATYGLSPPERYSLEYISPVTVSYPYNSEYATYELGDFYSSGNTVRIQIPNTSEYFWLANHQKESFYDGISQGGKICYSINGSRQDPYCGEGKGLYIYHENPNYRDCNFQMELDIEQADGKYDWVVERWVPYYVPGYNFCIPLFEPSTNGGNPLTGRGEFYIPLMYISNPPSCGWVGYWKQEVSDNPCSENINDYFVTSDNKGDSKDAFNAGYDEIFSPYSNPRSNDCDGNSTGITVKLLNNDHGVISVKVYFNNSLAISELPPSKPKNLKTSKHIVVPQTGRFNPKLTWDLNTEPDFYDPSNEIQGYYKIYRGVQYACNPDIEPTYQYIATVSSTTNQYIDNMIYLYPAMGGGGVCTYQFISYSYKIEAVDITDKVSLKSDRAIINGYTDPCEPEERPIFGNNSQTPAEFSLLQNYPNPFNPSTEIKFELPQNTFVTLKVYNAVGQVVAELVNNEYRNAGRYSVSFDGTKLASGIYFYSIEAGTFKDVKKMVLIK